MRKFLLGSAIFVLIAQLAGGSRATAGAFAVPAGYDTLSTDPPRFIDRFHLVKEACLIRAEPGSFWGSTIVPILGCVGSATVSCSFDSLAGVATFSWNPCNSWGPLGDDPGLIVGSEGGCFFLDGPATTQYLCMGSSSATPASTETWGLVKSIYR